MKRKCNYPRCWMLIKQRSFILQPGYIYRVLEDVDNCLDSGFPGGVVSLKKKEEEEVSRREWAKKNSMEWEVRQELGGGVGVGVVGDIPSFTILFSFKASELATLFSSHTAFQTNPRAFSPPPPPLPSHPTPPSQNWRLLAH